MKRATKRTSEWAAKTKGADGTLTIHPHTRSICSISPILDTLARREVPSRK